MKKLLTIYTTRQLSAWLGILLFGMALDAMADGTTLSAVCAAGFFILDTVERLLGNKPKNGRR